MFCLFYILHAVGCISRVFVWFFTHTDLIWRHIFRLTGCDASAFQPYSREWMCSWQLRSKISTLCWWIHAYRSVQHTAAPCDLMYWNVQSTLYFVNTHSASAARSLTESFGFHHTSAACLYRMLFFISLCWNTPWGHIVTPLLNIKFQTFTCRCWRSLVSLTQSAFFFCFAKHTNFFVRVRNTPTRVNLSYLCTNWHKYHENKSQQQAIWVDIFN